ncbi:MAG TPA: DUF4332 domain-containing protein [Candidatus Binatia bacterium]|nr:DUF4332 domain-containing protein [Candidatus Binatia bacterium]
MCATLAAGETDTMRPMIISITPVNNAVSVPADQQISVVFSEEMDPATINADTITVMRRTTPESGDFRSIAIPSTVEYSDHKAILTPNLEFSPGQQYGNVFTVTITTGVKDLAGNTLARNYVWSFTTGGSAFNAGATTFQADQSPTESTTVPEPSTPLAPVSTTKFPWMNIVIIGFGLLLLGALIVAFVKRRANQEQMLDEHPFGDVHPVGDLEGIGPEHKKGLQAIGIRNTKQLWQADAVKVAHRTGFPLSSVKSWQHMAELASIKDIGPQYAELLERSGVHSVRQLRGYAPNRLLKLVREKQASLKVRIQGNFPGLLTVKHWIAEARDHKKFTQPM